MRKRYGAEGDRVHLQEYGREQEEGFLCQLHPSGGEGHGI